MTRIFESKFYALKLERLYTPTAEWTVTAYAKKADNTVVKVTGITAALLHADAHTYVVALTDANDEYVDVSFEIETTDADVSDIVCLDTVERALVEALPSAAEVRQEMDSNSTQLAAIVADVGTDIPAQISTLDGKVDTIDGIVDDIFANTGTDIPAQVSAIATWTAANINSGLTAGTITQVRGNSWSFQVTGLTLYATKQQFVIKRNSQDTDAGALLFIDSVTGLITLDGVSTGLTAADASIVYAGTTLTVTVDASATAQLERGSWVYGIQSIHSDGTVSEVYGGTFIITGDTVRAVA